MTFVKVAILHAYMETMDVRKNGFASFHREVVRCIMKIHNTFPSGATATESRHLKRAKTKES